MDRGQVTDRATVARPVRVEVGLRTVRVTAVVPCFNRPQDLATLVDDLRACELDAVYASGAGPRGDGVRAHVRIKLSVVVVDNASEPPLVAPDLGEKIGVRLVRLARNTGGSGGYNAGMAAALVGEGGSHEGASGPDYLWLVDSDARVEPDTLAKLLGAMEADKSLVALGPVLLDTATGKVQEVGGRRDRKTGRFGPAHERVPEKTRGGVIDCDYVAACCALVRAETVRLVGLMPEVFLNADDVEWCLRLAREGGGRVVVLAGATASHPRFDRFAALPRYFGARNAFGPIDALGLGRIVRCKRALREVLRAVNQELMGRSDLAALHTRGLSDAAAGRLSGLPTDLPKAEGMHPYDTLGTVLPEAGEGAALLIDWPEDTTPEERERVREALKSRGYDAEQAARAPTRSLAAMLRRAIAGPRYDVAVVPAKGSPAHWFVAKTLIECAGGGFVARRVPRLGAVARCAVIGLRGGWLALRLGVRGERRSVLPAVEDTAALMPVEHDARAPAGRRCPALSVVVLSYNRKDALLETLSRLRETTDSHQTLADAGVIVVDNASSDGSAEAVCEHAPWATLLPMQENRAIAGFNRGVEAATGDLVLILDDDARPDPDALQAAVELLGARADLGAVTLVPVHPGTGASEWPFADAAGPRDDWPVMGCCNLVRRGVWHAVGGYEERFFLYRNDTDLAMKILAAGLGVHCNPAWRCEHDSPAASSKSARWCRTATRNWIWLARRHGRGLNGCTGAMLGWGWAHRLSGASPKRQWATLCGAAQGWFSQAPPLPRSVRPDGRAFAALLALRFRRR
ncbi:MAG: glycosyltransferase family 2 protein [Phycisphaerales bacterium JB041]